MVALAAQSSFLLVRQQPAFVRSFVLAALVHLVLLGVMFLGVRWQSHRPDVVEVELWEAPAPPPPRVVEPPRPPPPKVEPAPEVTKPDIAIKPEPKPKSKPEIKPEPKPKADPTFEKRMREQVATEQKALDEVRRERELRELLERQQTAARSKALDEYISRITAKVKSNWILPPDLKGNPEAIFGVVQLPTGEVLSARIVKSSGNPAYDTAVERAILKSSPLPLPLPAARELFSRELRLTFRPLENK